MQVIAGGFGGESAQATADGDPIADGKHADLDPWVSCQSLVELQDEVSVIPHVLPQWRIGWRHHRSIPEGVVVADDSAHLHQLDQSFMVVQIIVFIGVHEYEVKGAVIFPLFFHEIFG